MGAANSKTHKRRNQQEVNEQGEVCGELVSSDSQQDIDTTECEDILNNLNINVGTDNTQYDIIFHFDDFNKVASPNGCGISLGTRLQTMLWTELQNGGWREPERGEVAEVPDEFYSHFSLRDNFATVAVVGLFDKGKTFLVNKLGNTNLASGELVHTEGLSFKLPIGRGGAESNMIILDTAGSHSPVEKVTKEKIAQKKLSELFLLELSVRLADVVILVVNELTWPDQEFIECLQAKLNGLQQYQNQPLFIVHNFKNTTNDSEMEEKQRYYVTEPYQSGQWRSANPEGSSIPAKWYQTGNLHHFFLAKEGSATGDKWNNSTISQLRDAVKRLVPVRPPLLQRVVDSSKSILNNYIDGVTALKLYACNNVEGFPYSFSMKAVRPDSHRSNAGHPEGVMKSAELSNVGFQLSFVDNVFDPKVDTILVQDPTPGFVILADLPGFQTGNIKVSLDKAEDVVVIEGKRALQYYKYKFTASDGATPQRIVPDKVATVTYSAQQTMSFNQRPYTMDSFTKKIPIPRQYERKIASASLVDGVLQILILLENKVQEDIPWH